MRLAFLAVVALVAAVLSAVACTKPVPVSPTAQSVYRELVDAGCLADTDGGLVSVQEEYNTDAAPSWFGRLWEGGTIASCNTPCSSGFGSKP